MNLRITLLLALAVLLLSASSALAADPLRAHLGGGHAVRDRFGDLVDYIIFAEENSTVTPPPAFEIWQGSGKRLLTENIIDPVPPPPNPPRTKYDNNSDSLSHTVSPPYQTLSPTIHVEKFSYMTWHIMRGPSLESWYHPKGTQLIKGNSANQFVIPDLLFPLTGEYSMGFNVTMYTGEQVRFNRTVIVDPHAKKVLSASAPAGYNGTSLSPAPKGQLADFGEVAHRTATAQIELAVVSAPFGYELAGALIVQTDAEGAVKFDNVIPSLPGEYKFNLVAHLSNGENLTTDSTFQVDVKKALPVRIVSLEPTYGIARFQFFNQPRFQLYDVKGLIHYENTNITVSMGVNLPSVKYEGLSSLATLSGTKIAPVDNYTYTFTDLWVDLPGSYELNVKVVFSVSGDPVADGVELQLPFKVITTPTFDPPQLQVNTIGAITIHGDRPDAETVLLKLSSDIECETTVSDPVNWRQRVDPVKVRNISFVPYGHGDEIYVCLLIPTQSVYRPLIQHYTPSFNELYPRVLAFSIISVDECQPLTAIQAYQYQIVGWESATVGRRYGCNLSPPSAGTIPPCECPTVLSCEKFSHPLFRPANLNIGQCVCCTQWVMAISGTCTALFLAVLLSVVYFYV